MAGTAVIKLTIQLDHILLCGSKSVMQSEEKGDMMNTDRGQELMQGLHHC